MAINDKGAASRQAMGGHVTVRRTGRKYERNTTIDTVIQLALQVMLRDPMKPSLVL
jgi:hypothetical protein